MSGRGDDKSIEPAHQSPLSGVLRRASLEDLNVVARTKQAAEKMAVGLLAALEARLEQAKAESPAALTELLTEERVRCIAEEVGAKLVAGLEARLAKMAKPKADAAITLVESEVQRLALRLSDAEDQWRRTCTRHEAMFRRVEALETTAREIALAGSIGDKDFARRTSDDILARMDASNSDAAAVLMTPASETGWAIMDKDGQLLTERDGFRHNPKPDKVRWLGREPVNQYMMDAHAVFLDKATLQQVQLPKAEEQKGPPRETGWAVMDDFGMVFATDGKVIGFVVADFPRAGCDIRWLASRAEAETLARLLGVGRAAELYKDTLEEVEA